MSERNERELGCLFDLSHLHLLDQVHAGYLSIEFILRRAALNFQSCTASLASLGISGWHAWLAYWHGMRAPSRVLAERRARVVRVAAWARESASCTVDLLGCHSNVGGGSRIEHDSTFGNTEGGPTGD
jgi:hypothetical protein